jgi:hypothetical protein
MDVRPHCVSSPRLPRGRIGPGFEITVDVRTEPESPRNHGLPHPIGPPFRSCMSTASRGEAMRFSASGSVDMYPGEWERSTMAH